MTVIKDNNVQPYLEIQSISVFNNLLPPARRGKFIISFLPNKIKPIIMVCFLLTSVSSKVF